MTYLYDFSNNESLLKEIKYTGNKALSILPYNSVKLNYVQGRIDANTIYECGTAFRQNNLLQSIEIFGETGTFKKYGFDYAKDDLHSYLQEVKEYGADNFASQLNSTIFKYGAFDAEMERTQCTINGTTGLSINFNDRISATDMNGDGVDEIIVERTTTSNGNVFLTNLKILEQSSPYNFKEVSNFNLPGNTIPMLHYPRISQTTASQYAMQKEGWFTGKDYLNSVDKSDFNGDNKNDLLNISLSSNGTKLDQIQLMSFNKVGTTYTNVIKNIDISSLVNYFDDIVDLSTPLSLVGDFDGDGIADFIYNAQRIQGSNIPVLFKSFLFSSVNNFEPKVIKNLIVPPGISFPSINNSNITDFNFAQNGAIEVVNFDGDAKSDLMVKRHGNLYVFSLSKDAIGDYTASMKTINSINGQNIKLGDFNGDGKTDMLKLNPTTGSACAILMADGKGYQCRPFYFNNPYMELKNFVTTTGSLRYRDDVMIADMNGDGMSDIVHAYIEYVNIPSCDGIHKFEIYYSKGDDFVFAPQEFAVSDKLVCPQPIPYDGIPNKKWTKNISHLSYIF
jgi:hypothetical protein